jgi:hypothetical protein
MLASVHEDHGKNLPPLPPLSRVGLLVFTTARQLADPETAIVADRRAVGERLGLAERSVRLWLSCLETHRWQQRVLVQRRGARELWVLLADIPGIPARTRQEPAAVDEQPAPMPHERDRLGRKTGSFDWRKARAQMGGLKRAMDAAIRDKAAAEAQLERISSQLYADRQAQAALGVNAELAALRHDLQHCVTCEAMACPRCNGIRLRLGSDRERYATAVELSAKVDRAEAVMRAGTDLVAALRDQGVGAAERRARARASFVRLVEDS